MLDLRRTRHAKVQAFEVTHVEIFGAFLCPRSRFLIGRSWPAIAQAAAYARKAQFLDSVAARSRSKFLNCGNSEGL
jgi:hypothetical protein